MSNVIIWDIETVPDIKGFASGCAHAADPERIHLVLLEGRLVAGSESDHSSQARLLAPIPVTLWQPREPAAQASRGSHGSAVSAGARCGLYCVGS
jgi:hypothetical protein